MDDRRIFGLSSIDCYKLCQVPIANNDFIVDLKSVKHMVGINGDNLSKYTKFESQTSIAHRFRSNQYRNVKHLDLKFIFSKSVSWRSDSSAVTVTVDRFYDQLNRILASSNIESIDYNLTYKFPYNMFKKGYLRRNSQRYDWTNCKNGMLILFKRLKINTQNVKKLIATPTQGGYRWNTRNVSLFSEDEFDEFVKYFPNLDTFIIPKFHETQRNGDDLTLNESGIWSIFSKPYYWNRLKRIELNLKKVLYDDDASIDAEQHPLFHIHKFKNLQTLKLTLGNGQTRSYYEEILEQNINTVCNDLKNISLIFDGSGFMEGTMDNIWKYILSFSPNMEHYAYLSTIGKSISSYDHMIGHTDKLKSITTDIGIFTSINTYCNSLRSLHIHCRDFNYRTVEILKELFSYTPNLESFVSTCREDYWNDVAHDFLTYFAENKSIGKLKSIRLQSKGERSIGTITSEQSLKICKLLTSLSHLEYIQIHPLRLKRKEWEYLSFWFDGAFGSMQTNQEIWNTQKQFFDELRNFSLSSMSSSSSQKLPVVLLYTEHEQYQYQHLCNSLNTKFIDVSQILSEAPPTDSNGPFFWIAFTEQHFVTCLQKYPKIGIPIGNNLLLRYLSKFENECNLSLHRLQEITESLFGNFVICTSGIHQKLKNEIKVIVQYLHGLFDGNFTDATTHLIETNIGSAKHKAAIEMNKNCHIVTPKWLFASVLNGKIMNEAMFCPPLLANFFISVTGIHSMEREQMRRIIKQFGGTYSMGLSQQCTHLIINGLNCLNSEKCLAANAWNIPIVEKKWFYDFLKHKGCVDIKSYLLTPSLAFIQNNHNKNVNDQILPNVNDDEIDFGDDTELQNVIKMVEEHGKNEEEEEEIMDESDAYYLENCVVLLLCLDADLEKEAIDLLRRAKATRLSLYHSMGTHVITSDFDKLQKEYSECFDHCAVVSIDWLRHCDHTQSLIDTAQYNLLMIKPQKNEKKASLNSISTHFDNANSEEAKYEKFMADCLDFEVDKIKNNKLFEQCTFNVCKLSLSEQEKIEKMIVCAGGNIQKYNFQYLVCSNIATSEFEQKCFENILCVSVFWIFDCLKQGKLLNIEESVSYFPEILCSEQTNRLFEDMDMCITQFDNECWEKYKIQSLLTQTAATYHKAFHPKRCNLLICKKTEGPKYKSAMANNVKIVSFLWLIDSIKHCKKMKFESYTLTTKKKKNERKLSNISNLGDFFGANLQNALNNFADDDKIENNEETMIEEQSNLCSPALTTIMPMEKVQKSEEKKEVIDIIESDNGNGNGNDPMIDITQKQNLSIIDGISQISPIRPIGQQKEEEKIDENEDDIIIFCHRLIRQNKEKLINELVKNNVLCKAKSLNKNVTHYIIDSELTDKTKEMKTVKERLRDNLIKIKNSKWLHLKLKEYKTANLKNSITRARKRKYKDCDFTNFDDESSFDHVQIDDFSEDDSLKKHIKKRRKVIGQKEDIRKHIIMKHKIGVLLTGINGNAKKKKYEQIVRNLNGVILNDFDFVESEEVNFKYIVASKLCRSEKLILGIVQKKVIVKPSYLDSCKKAKKWISSEPFCWSNDEKLIALIPSDGTECNLKNQSIKDQVDIVQAIRSWKTVKIESNVFYERNVFVWVPNGRSNTYSKILRALKANVYMIGEEIDSSEVVKECEKIQVEIDEIYLGNEEEIKETVKAKNKGKGKKKNDETYTKDLIKSMRKSLFAIGKYWVRQRQKPCFDADFILDWTLEGSVFKKSDVKKEMYKFEIK